MAGQGEQRAAIASSEPTELAAGWVWEGNVRALLRMLALVAGTEFDDLDWVVIANELPSTNDEVPDGWCHYPLAGRVALNVALANSPGSQVVMVRVSGPDDQDARVQSQLLLTVLSEYRVQPGPGDQ